jgi:hypothetical protein
MPYAVQTAGTKPGGIVYVESNVQQLVDDGKWKSAVTIRAGWSKGTASQPDALIGYPGATGIQLGSTSETGFGSSDYTAGDGAPAGFWTVAELLVLGGSTAVGISGGDTWRFIGNDVSCPTGAGGGGGGGCFGPLMATHMKTFGNNFHDMAPNSTDRLQQGVYYGTDTNHIEHAWNLQSNSGGRTSLQTHSSPLSSGNGYILYDQVIHDNMIHDSREECVLLDEEDPSKGTVSVWNNVVWNCNKDGSGWAMGYELTSDFDSSRGLGTSPPPIYWYNNTVFVSHGTGCWGSFFPDIHSGFTITDYLQNNLCVSSGTPYWAFGNYAGSNCSNSDTTSQCQSVTADTNLVYGNGGPTFPNLTSNNINANPLLVNTAVTGCPTACVTDLHLSSASSPAVGAGKTTTPVPAYDIDGLIRPSPPSIGAYEFSAGTITKPNPPTGLQVSVQ